MPTQEQSTPDGRPWNLNKSQNTSVKVTSVCSVVFLIPRTFFLRQIAFFDKKVSSSDTHPPQERAPRTGSEPVSPTHARFMHINSPPQCQRVPEPPTEHLTDTWIQPSPLHELHCLCPKYLRHENWEKSAKQPLAPTIHRPQTCLYGQKR